MALDKSTKEAKELNQEMQYVLDAVVSIGDKLVSISIHKFKKSVSATKPTGFVSYMLEVLETFPQRELSCLTALLIV